MSERYTQDFLKEYDMRHLSTLEKPKKFTESQINQAYADSIAILFNQAFAVSAEDITPEVIYYVDSMIKSLAECSKSMTELSFNLIFSAVTSIGAVKLVDSVEAYLYPQATILGRLWIEYEPSGKFFTPVQEKLLSWVQGLQGNRRHMFCLATARSRYRSPIQIALLGL